MTNKLPSVQSTAVSTVFQGETIILDSLAEKRFLSPVIVKIEQKTFRTFVYMLITQTYIKCGQPIEADKITAFLPLFLEELEDYPWITITELTQAFKRGYKGDYGKYYGLNILTFINWIKSYVEFDRQEELRNLKVVKELPAKIVSEEDSIFILCCGVIRCFNEFFETGIIPYSNFYIYDFLKDHELIPTDDKFNDGIMLFAAEEIALTYNPKNARNYKQKENFKQQIKNISNPDDSVMKLKFKEIALRVHFDTLILKKIDFSKQLNDYIMKEKTAGIVCDEYKVEKFKELLQEKGFEFEVKPGLSKGLKNIIVKMMPKDVKTIKTICQQVEMHYKMSN